MNKLLLPLLALILIALPNCGGCCRKKCPQTCPKECPAECENRQSGVFSEKEVGWTDDDRM